ncbi:MAG: hypothetical protein AAF901_14130 [Bacteroidota bacterium]
MTDSQVEKSIQSGYLQLLGFEWLSHFYLPLLFLLPSFYFALGAIMNLIQYHGNIYADQREKLVMLLGFLISGILLFWIQSKRLKFKVVPIQSLKTKDVHSVINSVGKKLGWSLLTQTNDGNLFQAFAEPPHWLWRLSWGEMITVIFDEDRVLINSICNPDKRPSVTSGGRNARHVNTLINKLKIADME